jgi:hypothetical protein
LKKILPYILLWIFLGGSGGYFFIFKVEQWNNYRTIEKEIRNTNRKIVLQVLVFEVCNESGIKWLSKKKEFIYDNQMYDIVNYKVSGKYIHYYCINDTKEKRLITEFEKKNRTNDHSNQFVRKIMQLHFILPAPSFTVFRQLLICFFSQAIRIYLPPLNNILSPPPKANLFA